MNSIFWRLVRRPKMLFLIDGLGALITVSFLFVILRKYNVHFRMPEMVLKYLTLVALVFCFYSISCFAFLKQNWRPFLRAISMANLFYCGLTIALMIYYYSLLTLLGLMYFAGEVLVILALVFTELRVLKLTAK